MSSSLIDDRKVFEDGGESRPFFITTKKALYPADYVTEEEAISLEKTRLRDETVTVTVGDEGTTEASIETTGPKPSGKVFFMGAGADAGPLTFADSDIQAVRTNGKTLYEHAPGPSLEATVLELRMTTVAFHEPGGDPSVIKEDVGEQLGNSLGEDALFANENGTSTLAGAELVEGPFSKVLFEPRTVSVDRAREVREEIGPGAGPEKTSDPTPNEERNGQRGESETTALYEFAVGIYEGDAKVWYVTDVESTSWDKAERTLEKRLQKREDPVAFVKRFSKRSRQRAQDGG